MLGSYHLYANSISVIQPHTPDGLRSLPLTPETAASDRKMQDTLLRLVLYVLDPDVLC